MLIKNHVLSDNSEKEQLQGLIFSIFFLTNNAVFSRSFISIVITYGANYATTIKICR